MKHPILVALLTCLAAASTPLFAQDEGDAHPGRSETRPLKAEMEKLEEALDAVAEFLKKPEGDAPLAEITVAQEALAAAKKETPRTTERQPEDKRAEYVVAYKVEINKAIRGLLDLEDAMLQQDWKAAEAATEALKKIEKAGHDKFKPKRRPRGGGRASGGK